MKITIVTALYSEAFPLIDYYQLKKTEHRYFPIYQSENIRCIISGTGKINAATAVGSLGGTGAWLNIGIAGHRSKAVGESFIGNKIIDFETKKSIFPTMHPKFPTKRDSIFTVGCPENHYLENGAYDMEAYGFAQAALRFSYAELVQSYKIISDNITTDKKNIDKNFVKILIQTKLSEIDEIISTLHQMIQNTNSAVFEIYRTTEEKYRFSETQKHQLYSLLTKWNALGLEASHIPPQKTGKEVLRFLTRFLESSTYAF